MAKNSMQLTEDLIRAEGLMHRAFDRAWGWMHRAKEARLVCRRLEKRIERACAAEEAEREAKRQARINRRSGMTPPSNPTEEDSTSE